MFGMWFHNSSSIFYKVFLLFKEKKELHLMSSSVSGQDEPNPAL